MQENISRHIVRFFRFMRLFHTTMFSVASIEARCIYAIVAWEEDCRDGIPAIEDTQRVVWFFDDDPMIDDALTLGEYAFENGLISIDKLAVNESELQNALGWDRKKITAVKNKLMEIKVSMLDEGQESDAFFLHE